ncbi:manganese efflux pump MntP family protein [Spirochaetia bacterium 38H-sp]|uniref:Putative manganese efflux pump MntP n=1 Tax=Rarispira pelagica TaxID=3141764 RepID=A0ABU9U8P3_9SPIR
MPVFITITVGISLSIDACAATVSSVCTYIEIKKRHIALMAAFFGVFQAGMVLAGSLLGSTIIRYIETWDHWIAFILLAGAGSKMIVEGIRNRKNAECEAKEGRPSIPTILALSFATSIDALGVGLSLGLVGINITETAILIGMITLFLSLAAGLIGKLIAHLIEGIAEILGGIVLWIIGLKILISHIFFS